MLYFKYIGDGDSSWLIIVCVLFLCWSWLIPELFTQARKPQKRNKSSLRVGEIEWYRATSSNMHEIPKSQLTVNNPDWYPYDPLS